MQMVRGQSRGNSGSVTRSQVPTSSMSINDGSNLIMKRPQLLNPVIAPTKRDLNASTDMDTYGYSSPGQTDTDSTRMSNILNYNKKGVVTTRDNAKSSLSKISKYGKNTGREGESQGGTYALNLSSNAGYNSTQEQNNFLPEILKRVGSKSSNRT